jgi:hypothetical protein
MIGPGSAGVSPALLQRFEPALLHMRRKRAGETPALPGGSCANINFPEVHHGSGLE